MDHLLSSDVAIIEFDVDQVKEEKEKNRDRRRRVVASFAPASLNSWKENCGGYFVTRVPNVGTFNPE